MPQRPRGDQSLAAEEGVLGREWSIACVREILEWAFSAVVAGGGLKGWVDGHRPGCFLLEARAAAHSAARRLRAPSLCFCSDSVSDRLAVPATVRLCVVCSAPSDCAGARSRGWHCRNVSTTRLRGSALLKPAALDASGLQAIPLWPQAALAGRGSTACAFALRPCGYGASGISLHGGGAIDFFTCFLSELCLSDGELCWGFPGEETFRLLPAI